MGLFRPSQPKTLIDFKKKFKIAKEKELREPRGRGMYPEEFIKELVGFYFNRKLNLTQSEKDEINDYFKSYANKQFKDYSYGYIPYVWSYIKSKRRLGEDDELVPKLFNDNNFTDEYADKNMQDFLDSADFKTIIFGETKLRYLENLSDGPGGPVDTSVHPTVDGGKILRKRNRQTKRIRSTKRRRSTKRKRPTKRRRAGKSSRAR